jgi:hypothetical protein
MATLPRTTDGVIIGGGVHGTSLASFPVDGSRRPPPLPLKLALGVNCLAGLKQAVGNLDKVAIVRTLNFVGCTPEFDGLTSRSRRMRPTGGRSRGRRRAVSYSFPKSETSTRSSRS